MIARLKGTVDWIGEGMVIVDVNGVGYLAQVSARTLSRIGGRTGVPVVLRTEMQVREDHIGLIGFADEAEQQWFRVLCTVQGVGARVALAVLSVLEPEEIPVAIAAGDRAAFTRADGVGPKLATRILSELKDKVGDALALAPAAGKSPAAASGAAAPEAALPQSSGADAVSALVNLGYNRLDAFRAVSRAMQQAQGSQQDVGDIIRQSLKELSA